MKTNVLRVLLRFMAHFAKRLPDTLNLEKWGGVENAGNNCNYVICYKIW